MWRCCARLLHLMASMRGVMRLRGRTATARWVREGDLVCFEIEADSFMRHMNRVLVGTMLQVAGGRRTLEDFARLVRGAHRREAGPTAPPHGLYLTGVRY
jgi:tRNA pseudouridine38-40 synthase